MGIKRPYTYRRPNLTRAEAQFRTSLRGVARHVGRIISGFPDLSDRNIPLLMQLLATYAEALVPWSRTVAGRMLMEVSARDLNAWLSLSHAMSAQMRQDLRRAPLGMVMHQLLGEQVELIRSLPLEAAKRVHRLTTEALVDSTRYTEIAKAIERSGEVTESRAILIARTEVGRTATMLQQTRALSAGMTHYVWQTAHDQDVRPGHKAMDGKVCEWAHPPMVMENGKEMHFHAGCIWNCRCWAMPILTES